MSFKTVLSVLTLAPALALCACDKGKEAPAEAAAAPEAEKPATPTAAKADPHDEFNQLTPDEVEKMLAKSDCVAVDVNSDETRKEHGMVPGAVKLANYKELKEGELPDEKSTKLVFYCGSEKCSAAPKAATLAKKAGYEDVNVMAAGIKGWAKAGKDIEKPTS